MRKYAAYLLIALIGFPVFGVYVLFAVKQSNIKAEMREKITDPAPADEVQALCFTQQQFNQLNLEDDGRELRLNGKLYDVVSIEKGSDKVIVTVEFDTKETSLLNNFTAVYNSQQNDQHNNPVKNLLKHLQQLFYSETHLQFFAHLAFSHELQLTESPMLLPQYKSGVFIPPPQHILV